jgi:hypothetical protein
VQVATAVAGGPGSGRIRVKELATPPRRGAAREQQQQEPARHERRDRQRQPRDPALPPARVPWRGRRLRLRLRLRLRRRRRRAADPLLDVHAARRPEPSRTDPRGFLGSGLPPRGGGAQWKAQHGEVSARRALRLRRGTEGAVRVRSGPARLK